MGVDFNAVTTAYLNIRQARSDLRKRFDEEDGQLKESMTKLETIMLQQLNDSGAQSMRTDSGTFYKTEKIKPSASDWEAFYDWIAKEDAFDALERRIKAVFIKEYMEEHDGELPPGVSVHREYQVNVRRAS